MIDLKKIIAFEENVIRRVWHNEEWHFSIIDICSILTSSKNTRRYWSDLKRKLKKEGFKELYEKIVQLKLVSSDGKLRATDTANTTTIFRIIQSIPSPKAEPFKKWLSKVGYERVQEIENPELVIERIKKTYRLKGYDEKWIEVRLQSIGIRKKLTSEWQKRGVKQGIQYALLTAEISQATFGLKPSEHRKLKELKRQNLRDHMTDKELIFTMLGEISTSDEAQDKNAQGFAENQIAAKKGGKAAHKALQAYEKETGKKVVSSKNFLKQIAAAKKRRKSQDTIF